MRRDEMIIRYFTVHAPTFHHRRTETQVLSLPSSFSPTKARKRSSFRPNIRIRILRTPTTRTLARLTRARSLRAAAITSRLV